MENGVLTVSGGRVVSVERCSSGPGALPAQDYGPGVILPALVNAHTHLTLSAMAGKVSCSGGFLRWIRCLTAALRALDGPAAREAAETAGRRMRASGVGLAGEFGPHFPVGQIMAAAGLAGTVWLEFLGNRTRLPALPEPYGEVAHAYAGHAPNTASPALLRRLKDADRKKGLRFCLHLAESEEESAFLQTGKGPWADFLQGMGMSFSGWDCWGRTPVALANQLGLLDETTLAVHLLQVTPDDLEILARTGVRVCLCPRSNLKLHGRLPDVEGFLGAGMAPALGTDSLASCNSLSLFDEMRFVADRFPNIRPQVLLGMATVNGARALGRVDLGRIGPGSTARLIYVHTEAKEARRAAEHLVYGPPDRVRWLAV